MAKKKVDIKLIPDRPVAKLPEKKNGNWYDCTVSATSVYHIDDIAYNRAISLDITSAYKNENELVNFNTGDILICYLGFAANIGKGYEAHLIPRSSTFLKKGLLLGNSVGLIDDSYHGNNDEWMAVFYCTRRGSIRIGDRLCQMTIQKSNPDIEFNLVDELNGVSRGGFGSTGK